jgi:hypothetical protein
MKWKQLDPEMLRELLHYDPQTGVLTWKWREPHQFPAGTSTGPETYKMWNKQRAGKPALTARCNGYRVGAVWTVRIYAHRVAWAIHHGKWPEHPLDHINGDRADNRIVNLRLAPDNSNNRNRKMNRRNTSGVTGVRFCAVKQKWVASITIDGRKKTLGTYDTKDDAIHMRKMAEREHGYAPQHGQPDRPSYARHVNAATEAESLARLRVKRVESKMVEEAEFIQTLRKI